MFHVLFPFSLQECEQVLRTALRLADQQAITSHAISPIEAGAADLPLQQTSGTISDTIVREARERQLRTLMQVPIVGFNQSERQAFD